MAVAVRVAVGRHGAFANRQRAIAELPPGQGEGVPLAEGNQVQF